MDNQECFGSLGTVTADEENMELKHKIINFNSKMSHMLIFYPPTKIPKKIKTQMGLAYESNGDLVAC